MLMWMMATQAAEAMEVSLDEVGPEQLRVDAPIPRCGGGYGTHLPMLPQAPGFYRRFDDSVSHGSQQLLEAIQVVAVRMRQEWPEADPVVVGRLNQPGGQRNKWLMHQDGLDGDIGIYTGNGRQAAFGVEATPSTLDAEHTWGLIKAFMSTGRVQWILLDQSLIATVSHWAVAHGELTPEEAARMFPGRGVSGYLVGGTVMHATGHKNHMHVHMVCDG